MPGRLRDARRRRARTAAASSRRTTAATPAPARPARHRRLRLLDQQDPRRAAPSSWPRSSRSCATSGSARSRASAPRPAGRSRPSSCSCSTTRSRTGSSSSTSARRQARRRTGEPVDFSEQEPLGTCPKTQGHVFEFGTQLRLRARGRRAQPEPTCDFKSGKIILQQPVAREQMTKLLATGKTDLLDKLRLEQDAPHVQGLPGLGQGGGQGQLRVRAVEVPAQGASAPARLRAWSRGSGWPLARSAGANAPAKSATPKEPKAPKAPKAPRKSTGKLMTASPALAAVIGTEPVARTEVIKKLWDYIKATGSRTPSTSARSTRMRCCSRCSGSRR